MDDDARKSISELYTMTRDSDTMVQISYDKLRRSTIPNVINQSVQIHNVEHLL